MSKILMFRILFVLSTKMEIVSFGEGFLIVLEI